MVILEDFKGRQRVLGPSMKVWVGSGRGPGGVQEGSRRVREGSRKGPGGVQDGSRRVQEGSSRVREGKIVP